MLDIIEVASGDDPSVIDEQARSQFVTAEHRHQVLQGASVMNIAVEDLVKQRKTFRLGYPQADLDQGPAFDFFFVLPRFGQGTVATVEVGVGDDVTNMALDALALDPLVFDFGQIHSALTFDPADEAHSVYNIH